MVFTDAAAVVDNRRVFVLAQSVRVNSREAAITVPHNVVGDGVRGPTALVVERAGVVARRRVPVDRAGRVRQARRAVREQTRGRRPVVADDRGPAERRNRVQERNRTQAVSAERTTRAPQRPASNDDRFSDVSAGS